MTEMIEMTEAEYEAVKTVFRVMTSDPPKPFGSDPSHRSATRGVPCCW
jgi:hypothetical protein